MGNLRLIATAITLLFVVGAGTAPATAQSGDTSIVANATSDQSLDRSLPGYQPVTAGITPPKATHSPDPPYPDVPLDTEPRGVVVMLIGVNAHGHVGPVQVLRSSAPVFEKSAVATVKTWKFKPASKDGKPVPVLVTVEMNFAK